MMSERDWYGQDWRLLRSQILKLCLRYKDPLLVAVANGAEPPVEGFMETLLIKINSMIPTDKVGLWQYSLPLLVNREWLKKELLKDRAALQGEKLSKGKLIQPTQALARKFCLYLEMNRRQHIADEMGISSNRVKTWERLDRISRKVIGSNSSNRCTDEHFVALAGFIKVNHSHDKNLPRKAKTVKGYFYRFSKNCVENIEDRAGTMDTLSIQEAKDLLQGVGISELLRCLKQLSSLEMEVIDTAFQLGLSKVICLTIDSYLQAKHVTLEQFEQQRNEVIDRLRDCLETGITSRQGGIKQ